MLDISKRILKNYFAVNWRRFQIMNNNFLLPGFCAVKMKTRPESFSVVVNTCRGNLCKYEGHTAQCGISFFLASLLCFLSFRSLIQIPVGAFFSIPSRFLDASCEPLACLTQQDFNGWMSDFEGKIQDLHTKCSLAIVLCQW